MCHVPQSPPLSGTAGEKKCVCMFLHCASPDTPVWIPGAVQCRDHTPICAYPTHPVFLRNTQERCKCLTRVGEITFSQVKTIVVVVVVVVVVKFKSAAILPTRSDRVPVGPTGHLSIGHLKTSTCSLTCLTWSIDTPGVFYVYVRCDPFCLYLSRI